MASMRCENLLEDEKARKRQPSRGTTKYSPQISGSSRHPSISSMSPRGWTALTPSSRETAKASSGPGWNRAAMPSSAEAMPRICRSRLMVPFTGTMSPSPTTRYSYPVEVMSRWISRCAIATNSR